MNFKRMNGADLARACGVTKQAVSNWAREGCPRNDDGTYSLPAVTEWQMLKRGTGLRCPRCRRVSLRWQFTEASKS